MPENGKVQLLKAQQRVRSSQKVHCNGSSGADVLDMEVMQDVAYQEEIAVPDATGEEAIIPVENVLLDAENLPLHVDVRHKSSRHPSTTSRLWSC